MGRNQLKKIKSKGILLEVDSVRTQKIYDDPTFYVCECSYCRNFYKSIEENAPEELIFLLKQLGIILIKPSEAVENGPLHDKILYVVDYHFIGSYDNINKVQTELDNSKFDYNFHLNDRSLASNLFDDYNIVALRISIPLPWVLQEKYK
jgi:hypothetical protein